MFDDEQDIQNLLIQRNITLADKNWFKTGGLASYFCQVTNQQHVIDIINWAHMTRKKLFVLGAGANILVHDQGFDGLVIQLMSKKISCVASNCQYSYIQADAGVLMSELITWCLNHNYTGLEEFSGIPGSVGGSVFINIHYFEFLLSQFLLNACVVHAVTGLILHVDVTWFEFGYNSSVLQNSDYILLSATFKLKNATSVQTAYAQGRAYEIARHRSKRYPVQATCGSFFRNFLPNEVSLYSNNQKLIYAAYYLDALGFKGSLCVGQALVSHQHANMIINKGDATSTDIIKLAYLMQYKVYENFGIILQPECRLIGFDSYPLMS